MRSRLWRFLWLGVFALATAFPCVAVALSVLDSMKDAVAESPDHYISALVEYNDGGYCKGIQDYRICSVLVRVVEVRR